MENCIKGKTTCEEQQDDTCELTLTVNQSQLHHNDQMTK